MADLRATLEELGYAGVRTLLASGNVVLESGPVAGRRRARGSSGGSPSASAWTST